MRVLCAHSQKKSWQAVQEVIHRFHTIQWSVTVATDGSDALFKLGNSHFEMVILEEGLTKVTIDRVWHGVRTNKEMQDVPILWIGRPEKTEDFETEIERKKIIRVDNAHDSKVLMDAIIACLHFLSNRKQDVFNIHVLQGGEYLMRAGDPADHVYILKSGRLKALLNEGGQEKVLGQIEPGEFVGEMAYLSGERRSADVIAEDLCELVAIPIKQFEITLANRPSWGVALMKLLAKRLKQTNTFLTKKKSVSK